MLEQRRFLDCNTSTVVDPSKAEGTLGGFWMSGRADLAMKLVAGKEELFLAQGESIISVQAQSVRSGLGVDA